MKTRNLFFALVVGIALATVPLAGCGDSTDDPSANNSNNVNNVNNANNDDKQDVGGNNNGGEDTNNGGEDTNNGGEDTNNGGEDTNNGNNGGGDDCELNTTFHGQIGGSRTHEGGTFSTTPYTNDAGIQAVVDASDEPKVFETPMRIENARVVATSFIGTNNDNQPNEEFWIQDANAGIKLHRIVNDKTIKVGQAVSFDVLETGFYRGHVQITKVENLEIVEEDGPVYVQDKTGEELTEDDYTLMVRVAGTLSGGEECGGKARCYTMTHGDETVIFRSGSSFIGDGSCVTYVGPLGADFGPRAADGPLVLQLDSIHHDWHYAVRDDL